MMIQLGLLERQPIFRSKLLGNGSSYESIQRVILVAHKMDYKNHPHFTTIGRLVEENELHKIGQNDDPIRIRDWVKLNRPCDELG